MRTMKKIYILILLLAVASCQENTRAPISVFDDVMRFNLYTPWAQTKVNAQGFEATDNIGLYVTDYVDDATPMPLQVSGNRANNLTVSFDGSAWTPVQTIYWGTGKSDVYAYYPYICEIADVNDFYFEIATDQREAGYEASDFLWAKAEGVRQADGAVNLAMNHLMSKLTVKIVAGEDYVGSLPADASVLLHSTVTGARVNLENGAVEKDSYSRAKSIKMRNLGVRTYTDGSKAVVYEAIVLPQMLESSVPLLEINSKSVSYLLEDSFNFRPGIAYTYTATLNTSTTAIKVEIGCELEDWNSGNSSEGGEGSEGGSGDSGEGDTHEYTDLSAAGAANCYLVQTAGNYKLKAVIGNTDATVGNVKTVEVLWESFGTDELPNVGDLVTNASYKDGYIRFSTPETFREGNAVIAAKNSKGKILWSWHIWCCEEGWTEQVYYNDAGIMMDRNLGATSATPGDHGANGLLYQWGRKDPFLGSSPSSTTRFVASTGTWKTASGSMPFAEENPMTFTSMMPNDSWSSTKTIYDPCPAGWRVPDGGTEGVWAKAAGTSSFFSASGLWDVTYKGANFSGNFGADETIWYPASGGCRFYSDGSLKNVGGFCWSCNGFDTDKAQYFHFTSDYVYLSNMSSGDVGFFYKRAYGYSVRCLKDE